MFTLHSLQLYKGRWPKFPNKRTKKNELQEMNCNLFLSMKQIQPFRKINFNHLMEVLNVI